MISGKLIQTHFPESNVFSNYLGTGEILALSTNQIAFIDLRTNQRLNQSEIWIFKISAWYYL